MMTETEPTTPAPEDPLADLKEHAAAAEAAAKHPTDEKLFRFLRAATRTVREMCDEFDISPKKMEQRLDEFESDGYYLMRSSGVVTAASYARPVVATPAKTLADEHGMIVAVGTISDTHAGDRHSQPSAIKSISRVMYEEYGVWHFLQPGDATTGLYIYRGQEQDLLIEARPWSRSHAHQATRNQIWLADQYFPFYPGATWHMMGGNHDWAHVVNSGIDPIRVLVDGREHNDMEYCGYDAAGLWLTDKSYIRMWHPRGGTPYAKSYRLQKGLESLAIEALKKAIALEQNPVTSLLIAGHLHIAACLPDMPMAAMHPGCFEGQTNLGKQLGVTPALCGVVTRFYLTDSGRVQRIGWDWLYFDEIEDDWKNFPVPEMELTGFESEHIGPMLKDEEGNPTRWVEESTGGPPAEQDPFGVR